MMCVVLFLLVFGMDFGLFWILINLEVMFLVLGLKRMMKVFKWEDNKCLN